jgi:hypothetical protein
MKCFKKICVRDGVIVTLNADKDKYLNYDTNTNGDIIMNVCEHCHDCERLNFFELPKIFFLSNGGYTRIKFEEIIVLKDNASLKVIVYDVGQMLAYRLGNALPVDKSHCHLSDISIQMKIKRR